MDDVQGVALEEPPELLDEPELPEEDELELPDDELELPDEELELPEEELEPLDDEELVTSAAEPEVVLSGVMVSPQPTRAMATASGRRNLE